MVLDLLKIPGGTDQKNTLIQSIIKSKGALSSGEPQILPIERDMRLDLLCEVGIKAASNLEVSKLVDDIVTMCRQVLGASAASVLILDEKEQYLSFEYVDGEMGQSLKQLKVSVEYGISGWVVRHREPLIVNDVSKDERFYAEIDEATGFVTRSVMCAPLLARERVIGVIEALNKEDGTDFEGKDLEILMSLAATAAISIENARLHQAVIDGYKRTVNALAAAIDAKDPYTCGHSQRVREYALMAGKAMSLPPETMEALEYAGVLHDVGKIGIVESMLCKPSHLNPEEWIVMRDHPAIGAVILGDVPFLEGARELVLYHHERYDGTGYPNRLKKEDIPMGARLIAVADAFDTMVTDRAYRSALGQDIALDELHKCSGTQFCPTAVEAFITAFDETLPNLSAISPQTFRYKPSRIR